MGRSFRLFGKIDVVTQSDTLRSREDAFITMMLIVRCCGCPCEIARGFLS
jgi:hypothetical protein